MIALTVISVCLAGGAAACGGGGPAGQQSGGAPASGAQSSGTEQVMTVLRQLSRCIRSHGMPGFPDPIINPLTNQPDFPAAAPDVPASIRQSCQSVANRLPPDALNSPPPTAAGMQGLVRFARCMRSHGVANWPDPNASGEFPMTQEMAVQFKRAYRPAVDACIRYVPGGSQYLQFVAAPQPASGGGGSG
jgi:hypothetical protein